jgi:hypothetical protein
MDRQDRKLVLAWAGLLGLTLLSFESAWGIGWLNNREAAIAVVIVVALFKVRIVILHFMEVKQAPWALRAPLEVWVAALAAGILGLWYAAGA